MCRMLGAVGPLGEAAALLATFRQQAAAGTTLPDHARGHRDGWGIARAAGDGLVRHAGRSTLDASEDPEYPLAAARVAEPGRGVAMVHVRAASAGAVSLENTHPFIEGNLAFCHNGTVHGIAEDGESDSRAYFARILQAVRDGASPREAFLSTARGLEAEPARFSSLTALLTDGRTLWGVRKVGQDPAECADAACAADYYTLGVARVGALAVVAQEREFLPLGTAWDAVPDGGFVEVRRDGSVRTSRL